MFLINNYKMMPPYSALYLQIRDLISDIKVNVNNIEENTKREIGEVDRLLEEARKEDDFHEENYLQHNYLDYEIYIRQNNNLMKELSTLYNNFEIYFKRILLIKRTTKRIRNKRRDESYLTPLFEFLEKELEFDLSSHTDFKRKIEDLKFMRNWETHEGNDLTLKDDEVKEILDEMCDEILQFLNTLLEYLYNKK